MQVTQEKKNSPWELLQDISPKYNLRTVIFTLYQKRKEGSLTITYQKQNDGSPSYFIVFEDVDASSNLNMNKKFDKFKAAEALESIHARYSFENSELDTILTDIKSSLKHFPETKFTPKPIEKAKTPNLPAVVKPSTPVQDSSSTNNSPSNSNQNQTEVKALLVATKPIQPNSILHGSSPILQANHSKATEEQKPTQNSQPQDPQPTYTGSSLGGPS